MKNFSLATIGILAVALMMISSLFPSLFFVSPVSAQGTATIVVSGSSTGYNINTNGVGPDIFYTSSPPIMAAQKIGSGAVVAGGVASTARNGIWDNKSNPYPNLDVFLDVAFRWMVPGKENLQVLWFEGYGVYNTSAVCSELVTALDNLHDNVTNGSTQPITSSFLAPYDILVLPQLEMANPDLFPDNDLAVIKSFIEGGKGVFYMEQSDFQGYNYYLLDNKILGGIGFGYTFQHDQATDNVDNWGGANYNLITDVNTTFFGAYQTRTGSAKLGVYSVPTLEPTVPPPDYQVSVFSTNGAQLGNPGDSLTFPMTIKNKGSKPDTYTIALTDNLNWSPTISMTSVSLAAGESAQFTVGAVIPANLTEKEWDDIVVSASSGSSGASSNVTLVASAHVPTPQPMFNGKVIQTRLLLPGDVYYWFSANTMVIAPPAAPIMICTETGTGTNSAAGQTIGAPWPVFYGVGEYPPVGGVQFIGNGRVMAVGGLPILRSTPVDQFGDPRLAAKELMPLMARWLINWESPAGKKFLFFYTPGAFQGPANLSSWLNMVENTLGFDLTTEEGNNITPEMLSGYDVLMIVDEIPITGEQAITNWVENGGSLLLMEQGNYTGYGDVPGSNKILEALGCNMSFNFDEVYDNVHWTKDGPWFPQVYLVDSRQFNPNFDVWFPTTNFTANMPIKSLSASNVKLLFPFTILNIGSNSSSYKIEVQETTSPSLGWDFNWSPTEGSAAPGENIQGYITVTVPKVGVVERMNLSIIITDQTQTFLVDNIGFSATWDNSIKIPAAKFENSQSVTSLNFGKVTIVNQGYSGVGVWNYVVQTSSGQTKIVPESDITPVKKPTPGFPMWVIAAVVVVIIVVVAGGYLAMRKRGSPRKG